MTFSNSSQILGQILENLEDSDVSYDDRKIFYEILTEIFEDFGAKDLDECLDIDPAFDEVWNEKYPPDIEEYED